MVKLPSYTAETPPPRESGMARATDIGALTRTGDIEVWRGISQIGRSMQYAAKLGGQAYIQRQALDDRIATTEADTKKYDAMKLGADAIARYDTKAGQPLPDNPKDYFDGDKLNPFDTTDKDKFWGDTFNEYKGHITNLSKAIKHEGRRKEWVAESLAQGGLVFKKALNAKLQEHQETTILEYARIAAKNGDMELSNQWIDIAERHGLIGAKEAVAERENNVKEHITGLYRMGLHNEARKVLEASSLSNRDKESLDDEIDTDEKSRITQTKLAIEQKDNEIGDGFLDLLINKLEPTKPQLTFDMIKNSDLSFDAKDKWFAKLRVFDNYSEGELKEAFIDSGEVLADIYDRIDDNIITDDQIRETVGRGLSPTTAQRIIRERRQPYEKDTEQLFKRIFGWSPELGFENDLSSFLYEKSLREWQAEVKEQDATGEKIIEIGRSVVRPYFLEHLKAVMPSDTDIARMMELALGEEIKEPVPITKPVTPAPRAPVAPPVAKPSAESVKVAPPANYADFESEVIRLKLKDMKEAREYYDKWIGAFKK